MNRIALAALTALLANPLPAAAQPSPPSPPCRDPAALAEWLGAEYGETPVARGITDGAVRGVLVVFANIETGTWSAVLKLDGAPACVVESGEGWSLIQYAPPVRGKPS